MAGPYGSVGTDYRELQAPEQVRTDLPNNEAALRAQELESVFKDFGGIASAIGVQAQTQAGALAGAATGATGHPQYKEGLLRFTAYGRAYNNAATGAYAIEAEAQVDDTAARLRVQANNNPETFRATFSAARDAALKEAPAMAVPMLTELYNKRLAAGMAAISGDQAVEQQQTQRKIYDEGISRQVSRVANLQGSENPQDQLAAQDEQVKLSLQIDGGVNAGLYSKAEAEAMHINTARTITEQVFSTQVDRELWRPDGDVLGLIERFTKAHRENMSNPNEPNVLSEAEYQKLMSDAFTKIREKRINDSLLKAEGKSAEQIRYENGDKEYTARFLEGTLTLKDLSTAVRTQDLKPERATALRTAMENGVVTKSAAGAVARVSGDPNFLDMSIEDIIGKPGISNADKSKLIDEQRKRRDNWEGTQRVKDAKRDIDTALHIPQGTGAMLSEEQRKAQAEGYNEFIHRMNDVDPAKRDSAAAGVAQDVIKHAQQREAAADADQLDRGMQNFIKRYGPGGAEPKPDKEYQDRLKQYQDQIAQKRAQAKGQ